MNLITRMNETLASAMADGTMTAAIQDGGAALAIDIVADSNMIIGSYM